MQFEGKTNGGLENRVQKAHISQTPLVSGTRHSKISFEYFVQTQQEQFHAIELKDN